jgi:hypothetical protein
MKHESVPVGREHKRNVQRYSIFKALLHPVADAAVVVLRLNDCNGNIRLVIEDVVCTLGFAACNQFASNDDPALGKAVLRASASSRPTLPASQPG